MSSFSLGVALSATLSLGLLFALPANADDYAYYQTHQSAGVSNPFMDWDAAALSRYQALGITIEPDAVAPPYGATARHLSHAGATPYIPRDVSQSALSDPDRFMVMVKDACSFVDARGQRVINQQFGSASNFHEGVASVAVAGPDEPLRWGLIDRAGRWLVSPRYEAMGDSSQGLIRVMLDGKWGYINAKGQWVIPPRFDMAYDFTDGHARVSQDGRWGLLTTTGEWALTPEFTDMAAYGNGLIPVYSDTAQRWLFMSLDHQRMMVTKVEQTLGFNDGYAPIKMHGAWGLMNTVGNLTIPNAYREVGLPAEGLVPVQDDSGLWGYMTPQGDWVVAPSFDQADSFKGGRAWVVRQGEPEYIDHAGRMVMQANWDALPQPPANSDNSVPQQDANPAPSADDIVWTPPSEA